MGYKALTSDEIQKAIKFVEETLCVAEGVCPKCGESSKYYVVLTKTGNAYKEVATANDNHTKRIRND